MGISRTFGVLLVDTTTMDILEGNMAFEKWWILPGMMQDQRQVSRCPIYHFFFFPSSMYEPPLDAIWSEGFALWRRSQFATVCRMLMLR